MEKVNLFKNRNFTLTFLGALVSNIGNMFYSFACSFYILDLTNNNATIQGLYLALSGLVFCIVVIFGGVISDRFNKGHIMYICDYLKGALILCLALSFFFIESNQVKVILLFACAILSQVIAGIFSPASGSLIPEIVELKDLQKANSYFQILSSFQSIVGSILAAVLYSLLSPFVLFLIVSIAYILSAISEMFIKIDFKKKEEKMTVRVAFSEIKDGVKFLSKMRPIFALLVCIIFINFFFAPVDSNFLPYFVKTDLVDSAYILKDIINPEMIVSIAGIAIGLGSIICGFIMSSKEQITKCAKTTRRGLIFISTLLLILSASYYVLVQKNVSLSAFIILLVCGCFIIGMLVVYINIPSSTVMQLLVPQEMRGKVNAVSSCASQGLIPLATFLGGIVLSYCGKTALLLFCSIGFLVTTLLCLFNKNISEI